MSSACIDASPEIRAANRIAFDTVCDKLRKQLETLNRIKAEILNIRDKAISLRGFLTTFDRIYERHKALYNMYVSTFLATIDIYLGTLDETGQPYIPPVTDDSKTTDISVVITMPHSVTTQVIATVNNMSVDTTERDVKIGNTIVHVLTAEDLATIYSSIQEEPVPYYSKDEFLAGIALESEKLMLAYGEVVRTELLITASIKYISELKTIGIY